MNFTYLLEYLVVVFKVWCALGLLAIMVLFFGSAYVFGWGPAHLLMGLLLVLMGLLVVADKRGWIL